MRKVLFSLALLLPVPALASPVARAIAADDVEALRVALARGADANAALEYGETPLARAVEAQDPALVAVLLKAGAKPDRADALGLTPLLLACERGHSTIVQALLDAGADARRARADGVTPLAMCARFSDVAALRAILARGAEVDSVDARGQTPLMWAASAGQQAAASALVQAGAAVNRVTANGFTPLFFALASGNADVASALIAAGADARHRGPENTSALQMALYQKNWGAAEQLVGLGADVSEPDREGRRPLHVAAAAGQGALIAALLEKGAVPDALTEPSRIIWVTEANFGMAPPPVQPTTALLMAAKAGQADAMWQLVRAGADEAFVDGAGVNVVLAAAQGRSAPALALALELADNASDYANVADKQKTTALHMLAGGPWFEDLPAMLRLLARHGARADIADGRGKTARQVVSDGLATVQAVFHDVFPVSPPKALAQSR